MRLAIISDSHDNLATLAKFLNFADKNGVETILHCGDVAEAETLEYLTKKFSGKIYVSEGNMDYGHRLEKAAEKFPDQVYYFKDFGRIKIDGLSIGLSHFKETAAAHCKDGKLDFVFYGHTHKPWQETVYGCLLSNPGNLAGMFYKATFATLDTKTKKLDLKIVENLRS